MRPEKDWCKEIKIRGWKQGSLFFASMNELGKGDSREEKFYLLVTHSCDIVHKSFEDEPYVEAIQAKKVSVENGQLTHGKSPRKIQIQLKKSDKTAFYEFSIVDRIFFDRTILAKIFLSLEYKIEKQPLENLINWLTKRYNRAAFPNIFNQRMNSKVQGKLKNILKKFGREIICFLIRLNSYDELSEQQLYEISLVMLIDENSNNDEVQLNDVLEKIVEILKRTRGIDVLDDYRVLTPKEITLEDFLNMQQWDFDYLSYRDKPGGKTINHCSKNNKQGDF